jgi:voltage-gated potassium channel Kch
MSPGTLLRNLRPEDGTGDANGQGTRRRRARYGLLLLVLMVSYVLSAFIGGKWVDAVQIGLFLGVSLLAVRAENVNRRAAQLVAVVIVTGSVVAAVLALNKSEVDSGLAYSWSALMLLFAAGVIVRRVLAQPEVSLQSIFGAISAYMIIGLMFAAIYEAINKFTAEPFFAQGAGYGLKTFQYFSFTTLTTLGYGDYTAKQPGGQAVAVMEALLGQIFLATLVARLVAAFRGISLRQRADAADPASAAQAAGPGNQAGPVQDPSPRNQADPAQPAGPGNDPTRGGTAARPSPRARARQARRARLRPE